MAEIHELEPVDLREAWPHEAWNFTPWLAERLHLLGRELNLDLELVETEVTLPEAGRVDILAKQVGSGARVVIENQFGWSNDSHCLRLLGYAAHAESDILVWVAEEFTEYHRGILAWLNQSDTINAYAVEARAYRVGDSLAADFRLAVGPQAQSRPSLSPITNRTTFYALFYRPLVEELRRREMPPVGRGGFRGRWRSFETGYPDAVYATELGGGEAHAFLQVYGDDKERIYEALTQRKDAIDAELEGETDWEGGDGTTGTYWIGLATEAMVEHPEGEAADAARQWLADNLLRLRKAIQPHLDQVMQELARERDGEAEAAE